ncbi:MAG: Do family serine endopeptidase [Spirochaetaceae bacterium]|jgi:Do/DeqQ family serine protease|nr:Do family serine endopeptidase [Spirochaetaceae bacterium]
MNLVKKLSSKHFFVFNLVLLGVLFGFSLAFLSFSCSGTGAKNAAHAQSGPETAVPKDALAVAESLQNAFRAISNDVVPSVVELKTVSVRKQQTPNFNGIPFEFFFGPQQGDGGKEREYKSAGLGSGIIVRQQGNTYYVLTNNHVVVDTAGNAVDEIKIAAGSGKEFDAELVGHDQRRDLAMVKFESKEKFPIAKLGDSDKVAVGDWAIAVGNPLGFESSVTMGIVSAIGRTGGPGDNINDFIQTDASINQGNSGGALVNIRGEVIGINMWIASSSGGGSMGLGFAIPINNALRTIDEFINSGTIKDGWLGVSLIEADKSMLEALGLEGKQGALASGVFLDSPAAKGGIEAGDFIIQIDGKDMRTAKQLTRTVSDLKAGEEHKFTVLRGNKTEVLTVKISERKNDVAADNGKLWPGVFVIPITDDVRDELKLSKTQKGLFVVQVYDKTPSAVIGLQRQDIIIAVNDQPVNTLSDFYKVLREKASKELWFDIQRQDHELETMRFKR